MTVTELGQSQGMAWARSAHSSFTGAPLAELQQWQGGKKTPKPEPKPVRLEATTGPEWKSSYRRGEKLSLDGLTLTVVYNDGSEKYYQKPFNSDEFNFYPYEHYEMSRPITLVCTWYGDNILSTQLEIEFTDPVFKDIIVDGPARKSYAVGEQLSLEGLVVKAKWQQPDGSYEYLTVPEKLGTVTDGYSMSIEGSGYFEYITSEKLPAFKDAGYRYLHIRYNGIEETIPLKWMALQPAIEKIQL